MGIGKFKRSISTIDKCRVPDDGIVNSSESYVTTGKGQPSDGNIATRADIYVRPVIPRCTCNSGIGSA